MGTAVSLDITRAPTADGLGQASVPRPEELRRGLPPAATRCTPGLGRSGLSMLLYCVGQSLLIGS